MNLPLKVPVTNGHNGLEGHQTEGRERKKKQLQSTITKGARVVSEKQLP